MLACFWFSKGLWPLIIKHPICYITLCCHCLYMLQVGEWATWQTLSACLSAYEKVFLQLERFPHNNLTIPHLPCFLDFQFPEQDRYKAPCTEQRWLFLDLSQSCSGTKLNWGNFTGFILIYWSVSCWCVNVYASLNHTATHRMLWYSNYAKLAVTPCMQTSLEETFLIENRWFCPTMGFSARLSRSGIYSYFLGMDELLFKLHFEPLNSKPEGFDFEMTGKGYWLTLGNTQKRGVLSNLRSPWMLSGLQRKPLIECVIEGIFQNCKGDLQANYKLS